MRECRVLCCAAESIGHCPASLGATCMHRSELPVPISQHRPALPALHTPPAWLQHRSSLGRPCRSAHRGSGGRQSGPGRRRSNAPSPWALPTRCLRQRRPSPSLPTLQRRRRHQQQQQTKQQGKESSSPLESSRSSSRQRQGSRTEAERRQTPRPLQHSSTCLRIGRRLCETTSLSVSGAVLSGEPSSVRGQRALLRSPLHDLLPFLRRPAAPADLDHTADVQLHACEPCAPQHCSRRPAGPALHCWEPPL